MFHESNACSCYVCQNTKVHQCFQSVAPFMTKGSSPSQNDSRFSFAPTQFPIESSSFCYKTVKASPTNISSRFSKKAFAPSLQASMNELWEKTNSWESYFSYSNNAYHDKLLLEELVTKHSSQHDEETGPLFWTEQSTQREDSCDFENSYKKTPPKESVVNKNATRMSFFNTLMQSLEHHRPTHTCFAKSQEVPETHCLNSVTCLKPFELSTGWEECSSWDLFQMESFLPDSSTVVNFALNPSETPFLDDSQKALNTLHNFGTTHIIETMKETFQWNASLNHLLEYCKRYHEAIMLQKTCFSFEDSLFLDFVLLMLYKENRRPSKQRILHCLRVFNGSTFLQNNFLKYYQIVSSKYRISSFQSNKVYIYLKKNPSWFQGWTETELSNCPLSISFLIEFHDYLIQLLRWNQMKKMKAIFLSNKTSSLDHCKNMCVLEKKEIMPKTEETSGPFPTMPCHHTYFLAKQIKDISSLVFSSSTISQLYHSIELATHLGLLVYEDSCIVPKASSFSVTSKFVQVDTKPYVIETNLSSKLPLPVPNTPNELKSHLEQSIKNVEDLVREKKFKPLLLSQLKTKYFQKYHQELDTLALGYPRLSDFLKQYCSHVCRFIRTENRQVFVDRLRKQCKDLLQTGEPVLKTECEQVQDKKTNTTVEENDSLTVSEALLSLLSKHRRFHNNISFSFWQYCTFCNKSRDQDVSLLCSAAATFTDLLFATILKPTCTEPFVALSQDMSSTNVSSLRWFTREPLIQRRLHLNTFPSDNHTLHDFVFNVLPPKLLETPCESEVFKLPRPSRLRRYITSQMVQLNQGIFNAVPNIVIY